MTVQTKSSEPNEDTLNDGLLLFTEELRRGLRLWLRSDNNDRGLCRWHAKRKQTVSTPWLGKRNINILFMCYGRDFMCNWLIKKKNKLLYWKSVEKNFLLYSDIVNLHGRSVDILKFNNVLNKFICLWF